MVRSASLDGISSPTAVYLKAVVASPNEHASPVTGRSAALIQWYVFGRGHADAYEEIIADGIVCEMLLLVAEDRIVRVPTRYLEVYVAAANAKEHLLLAPLPPGLSVLTTSARAIDRLARGELNYREHLIELGDRVRLRAVVAPHERRGAYRTIADDELIAIDELEHPSLSIDVPEFA